jgi:pyridoxamine 5'-phosphate oxidase
MIPPSYYDDLIGTREEIWRQLARGVADRKAAFHTPALATISTDGQPRLRTVVLRGFDPALAELTIHTDRRSEKFAELSARPGCAILLYDPGLKQQLRVTGRASLHLDDAVADQAWARSGRSSRVCYQLTSAPGEVIASPYDGLPEPDNLALGRPHFSVIRVEIAEIEWLYLASAGHRRARFVRSGDGPFSGEWLVP